MRPLRWRTIRASTIGIIARCLIAFALAAGIIYHAESSAQSGRHWSAERVYAAIAASGMIAALLGLVLLPFWAASTRGRIAMLLCLLWFAAGLAGLILPLTVVRFT